MHEQQVRDACAACSHQSTPVCAWDLRNMSYPVHQGRLDHSALPLPTTGLPQAVWHTNSKALFLSAHDDYLLGHADNGAWPPSTQIDQNLYQRCPGLFCSSVNSTSLQHWCPPVPQICRIRCRISLPRRGRTLPHSCCTSTALLLAGQRRPSMHVCP